jgi:hypothetical protein
MDTLIDSQEFVLFDQQTREQLGQLYTVANESASELIEGMEEADQMIRYPALAKEGLIGEAYNFVMLCLRSLLNLVEKVIAWFSEKINHFVNIRQKVKKHNDGRVDKFRSLYTGFTVTEKAEANTKFKSLHIDYCPPHQQYIQMCNLFNQVTNYLASNVTSYVSRDVALFWSNVDPEVIPAWCDAELMEVLAKFGIKMDVDNFSYTSPFTAMPRMTMDEGGYNIESIADINYHYAKFVYGNLRIIIGLKKQFEEFENVIKLKEKEAAKLAGEGSKASFAAATKKISKSIAVSIRLTNYLTQIEEALDTRRGWISMRGVEACVKTVNKDAAAVEFQ